MILICSLHSPITTGILTYIWTMGCSRQPDKIKLPTSIWKGRHIYKPCVHTYINWNAWKLSRHLDHFQILG